MKNYWLLGSFCVVFLTTPYWPAMPEMHWLSAIIIVSVASLRMVFFRYFWGIGLAISIIMIKGNVIEAQSRTVFKNESDITIKIRVDSYFKQNSYGFNGDVSVLILDGHHFPHWATPKVRLYGPVYLPIGSVATVTVRMKPIWGLRNEAGFDSETYFFSRGIIAKAFVQSATPVVSSPQRSFKYGIYQQVSQSIQTCRYPELIHALAFADRTGITPSQWQYFQSSGLAHLMAISGLHIGIAFFIGWYLGRSLAWVSPMTLWCPLLMGALFALGYAWLAGFSISTLRALIMVIFNGGFLVLRFRISVIQRYLLTLAVVLILDPFACYATGFWLSFLAVLFVFSQGALLAGQSHRWRRWVMNYLGLSLCLLPVSAYYLGGMSLLSPLYNMVFIPWFSLVVVPLLFLALILTGLGLSALAAGCWSLVDDSLHVVMVAVSLGPNGWVVSSAVVTIALSGVVVLWLGWRYWHGRLRVWLAMATFALFVIREPASGWRVDILDVGQGLAVLIEKDGHLLLYDTGKSWVGGSMAQSVITPVMAKRGTDHLDGLILSHLDDDHAGGRIAIEARWQPQWRWAGQPVPEYVTCQQGMKRAWQGLTLEVLWPVHYQPGVKRNIQSCVLRIRDPVFGQAVVFTGDIDKKSEWQMIRQVGDIRADVLIVPHHGSATSSSSGLIRAVSPTWAIASLAHRNPWYFPNPAIVDKYRFLGVNWLDTSTSGQITIKFFGDDRTLSTIRRTERPSWYRHMLRKQVK